MNDYNDKAISFFTYRENPSVNELIDFLLKFKYYSMEEINKLYNIVKPMEELTEEVLANIKMEKSESLDGEVLYYIEEYEDGKLIGKKAILPLSTEYELVYLNVYYEQVSSIMIVPDYIYTTRIEGKKLLFSRIHMFVKIVTEALNNNCSDIHIQPNGVIFFRIGSRRYPMEGFDFTYKELTNMMLEVFTTLSDKPSSAQDLLRNGESVCGIDDIYGDGSIKLRLESLQAYNGVRTTIRIQVEGTMPTEMDGLGFPEKSLSLLRQGLRKRTGLSAFTGPTKTGKSVSANAMLLELARNKNNYAIAFICHPIEFNDPRITVIDYKDNPTLLSSIVRATKKMDLDYLMVGEVPEQSVALSVADVINSATHVITTWHQTRAYTLPYRLQDFYRDNYKAILSQINFICNQRLYDTLCDHCKVSFSILSLSEKDPYLADLAKSLGISAFYKAEGCEHCNNSGFDKKRRIVVPEVLLFTSALTEEVQRAQTPYEIEVILRNEVKRTESSLEINLARVIKMGLVDIEELATL